MTITLAGTNNYSRQAELKRLIKEYLEAYGDMGLERLDGEEAEYERLQEALTSLPFLVSKKLVIIRAASTNKIFVQNAEQLLAELPDTTQLVLVEPKLDKRSTYYKLLKKSTDYRDFPEIEPRGLAAWLGKAAKEQGGSISTADAIYLVDRIGPSQQILATEIEKLVLYNPHITRQTIDLLTELAPQSTIFALIEAAFGGNIKRTLAIYDEQRVQKVEPQQIIALLTWQLHILALLKTADKRSPQAIASEAKVSPYVVQKSAAIAHKLTATQLKEHISHLLELDIRLKTEAINADDALKSYLMHL